MANRITCSNCKYCQHRNADKTLCICECRAYDKCIWDVDVPDYLIWHKGVYPGIKALYQEHCCACYEPIKYKIHFKYRIAKFLKELIDKIFMIG